MAGAVSALGPRVVGANDGELSTGEPELPDGDASKRVTGGGVAVDALRDPEGPAELVPK